jgi:excisionase family DNA binding protein
MLTLREINLARSVVEELRSGGADEKAAAIERVISTAESTLNTGARTEPVELFTTGQAARALGVSVQTIKNWANAGQLQSVRLGGRVMIHRDPLLDFLDRIRQSRPSEVRESPEPDVSIAQRQYVLSGLPAGKVERVRALSEKIEASQPLTPEEEKELAQLQDELAHESWKRLKQWVAQHQPGSAG